MKLLALGVALLFGAQGLVHEGHRGDDSMAEDDMARNIIQQAIDQLDAGDTTLARFVL